MLNSNEIKDYKFSEVRKGYDVGEVDELLDKVYADYKNFENLLATKEAEVLALQKEISENKSSAESINTVLISAQKLADSIVADAKKNAEQIVIDAETEATFEENEKIADVDEVVKDVSAGFVVKMAEEEQPLEETTKETNEPTFKNGFFVKHKD